jgi:cellobiose transport system permease protein
VTTSLGTARAEALPALRTQVPHSLGERLAPYTYIAPFFLIFAIFGLFPLLFTFYVSLFDWNPIGEHVFIGLDNFTRLFHDVRFWNAARNTVSIWLLSTVPQLAMALVLAHLLNHARLRLAVFLRMSMLVPYVTSVAATAIVFAQMFDRDYGLLNWLLGFAGVGPIDFRHSVWGSHLLIAAMVTWRWFGYTTLLYLASLQAIPRAIYEAAAVDGAGAWKQFRHVTIPMISPILLYNLIIALVGTFQYFTQAYVLTNGRGDPNNATLFINLDLFREAFVFNKMGYGSAIAWLLFVLVMILTLAIFGAARGRVYYAGGDR